MGTFAFGSNNVGYQPEIYYSKPSEINVIACTVNETNINVPMGGFEASSFSTIGSVITKQSFNVNLGCQQGVDIYMTVSEIKTLTAQMLAY